MRLRVLLSGLTFFAVALAIGVLPALARAHPLNASKLCTQTGTQGKDVILGTPRADVLCGLGGNDALAGLGGDDVLRGGPGADRIQGDAGRDTMLGGYGNDVLWSYDGTHDHVNGGPGFDRLPRHDRTLDAFLAIESFS